MKFGMDIKPLEENPSSLFLQSATIQNGGHTDLLDGGKY
jgi:hypothetical protein